MRTLVTGGAGFIGSVIVEELLATGHEPIVYDSFTKGHRDAIVPGVPVVEGDVADTGHVRQAIRDYQIEAIIHMAALIEIGISVKDPNRFFETNVAGSVSVLRAMIDTDVRKFVFSSTAAVYSDPERLPIQEDDPVVPTNPYGDSKMMVERIMGWDALPHGLVCTSLRYFNAAGASERNGEDHEPETHLIPLALRAAAEGTPLRLYGTDYPTPDGTTIRDYVHVRDLAQAHLLALGRDEIGLRVYNVGSGAGYSVREVIETIRAVTGRPLVVEEYPRRGGDQAATVASSQRIRTELGWEPRFDRLENIVESAWLWRQAHPNGYER